ncbi:unnamed protein product [Dicrocoelium dendriticum]|nr:unnamed protein product [Dicrocoelium dendriticum]
MCNRPFARDDKLKRHIRCVHSSERPFKCEVCSKAFARKDKLQEHARHHNRDITFTCSICSEVFVMRSHLNRHLRGVHKMKLSTFNSRTESTITNAKASLPCNKSAFTPVNNGLQAVDSLSAHMLMNPATVLTPITTNVTNKSTKPRRRSTARRFCPSQENAEDATKPLLPSFCMRPNSLSAFSIPSSAGADASLFLGLGPFGSNPAPSFASATPNLDTQHISADLPSSHRFPAYSGGESVYRNQPANQTYSQQQFAAPQPQQQTAWSAAMAASLFGPVNYVGWWPQANANFMLPYSSSCGHTTTSHSSERPSSEPSASIVSQYPPMANVIPPDTGFQPRQSQAPAPTSSITNTLPSSYNLSGSYSGGCGGGLSGGGNSSGAGFVGSTAAPAHMLASLPTFAQAMYYQAASWVANQNGGADAQGRGGWETSGAPKFPTPYSSTVPNNQDR